MWGGVISTEKEIFNKGENIMFGNKPDCECNQKITDNIKEKHSLTEEAFVYFKDQNIFTGSLVNYISIEHKIKTKAGKEKMKTDNIPIVHNYCPFCGKKYLDETV